MDTQAILCGIFGGIMGEILVMTITALRRRRARKQKREGEKQCPREKYGVIVAVVRCL